MEAKDFSAWIDHMGYSDREASRILDISRTSVAKYRAQGAPSHIGYACAALALDIAPWVKDQNATLIVQGLFENLLKRKG